MSIAEVRRDHHLTTVAELGEDWELSLTADNKSEATRMTYLAAVHQLAEFLAVSGMPVEAVHVTREHVEAFLVELLATRSASTAKTRHGALKTFFAWCVEDGEISRSPMEHIRPPKVPEVPIPLLSDDQLKAILATCAGRDFQSLRDNALIRLFCESGLRRAEVANMTLEDLDLVDDVIRVVRKGRRVSHVSFGSKTKLALKRYLRARNHHRYAAGTDHVWLGKVGPITPDGLFQMIQRRGAQAGIEGLHPHMLRHAAVQFWLANGGSEGDAMKIFGWRNRAMLDRYAAAGAEGRAIAAHHAMAPGDRF